jgi:hypothetical protein
VTLTSSKRRNALRACALLAGVVGTPAACTLDLAGKPTGGAESTSTSTTATGSSSSVGGGASTSTTTSGSSGTGGAAPVCDLNEVQSCYDGTAATRNKGACKDGMQTCLADGTAFGMCQGQTLPAPENCLEPADEDCDGAALACTGTTLKGGGLSGGASDDVIFAVATDLAGTIFVGGVSGANAPSGQGFTMASGIGGVAQILANGTPGWSTPMTSTGASSYSVVRGLATDKNGNVFVVGELLGAATIGGMSVVGAGAGGIDVFLAKLDPMGKPLWAKAFGNGADQYGYGISSDAKGNVFITGRSVGAVDFGGGAPGVSAGAGDNLFVAKFDNDGKYVWSKAFGDDSAQIGYGVAATPAGDAIVTGALFGLMDFGGGVAVASAGSADVFVAKLDGGTGAAVWAHHYGDDQEQAANSVAVGSDGGIVLTGGMVGHCKFGAMDLDAKGKANVFVAKLKPDGSPDWSHDYGTDGDNQVGFSVAIDPALNILVVGYLKGSLSFGGSAPTVNDSAPANSGNTDMFVAKLSADGAGVWARGFGDMNDQTAWAVTADPVSNVIFGGAYAGTVNLPPSTTATGSYDALWAKLAP